MKREKKPIWDWSQARVQRLIGTVTAGRDLTPKTWPNDATVAVALSFDFDAETGWLYRNMHSSGSLARGTYGARVGMPRILKLLENMEIPASFFVPVVAAQQHPGIIDAIVEKGHEIGVHGWVHEIPADLTPALERELLERMIDYWRRRLGYQPVGIRTPAWDVTPHTVSFLKEMNFQYDSSLMGDDRPYELVTDGTPTGIVELPVEWLLDDYPYMQIMRENGFLPYIKPRDVMEIWKAEFEVAREEGTMFLLTMHPQVIGHRARWSMLREFVMYLRDQGNVWFARHDEIAEYVKSASRG